MMNWFYRILSILIAIPMMYILHLLGGVLLMEGKNLIFPYIDTEFAPHYTPAKFDLVNDSFSYSEVKELLGEPLYEFKDSIANKIELHYTNDGKVLSQELSRDLVPIQDFAWYRSNIYFDSDGKIERIDYGWSYD